MNKRVLILIVGGAAALGFCFFSVFFFPKGIKNQPLPTFWSVQDFRLLNQEGTDVSLNDFKGKIWIADFVFTTCGSICPLMTKNMASLQRSYLLEKDVMFASISVNPEFDTPEVLKTFAEKWAVNNNKSWHFLTGQREDIQALAVSSFKLGDMKEPVFHSDKFILVDEKGVIRGFYSGTQKKDVEKLFFDTAALLKEKRTHDKSAARP